eukprot:CAMPEP_0201586438 /NCGR_PEP_ID=MMETSP0190_2-20130828/132907_1 /ASSEMBLY_ACC=CAM_ASM_000263 /TAXON_ID=37353 /ORGANISM="Rosalina sp." /LENGTH=136 /DNA_ID=CAMNT_0048034467 /DNA_START=33 /DNA_END=440 /DNA_ORIENTATION=-
MSTKPTENDSNTLKSVSLDVSRHLLSFLPVRDVYAFARANKNSYLMIKRNCLDSVHQIAWIEADGFHIKPISSTERHEICNNICLWSMIVNHNNDKTHDKEYLLESFTNNSFDWAMFIRKQHRGVDLNETKGYWKM